MEVQKIPLAAPEQDYLARYYVEGWYCLGIQWNYQLHQLAYRSRAGASESVRINMDYEKDVHMVHFSGKLKPSHWMFG
jgi:lipopolysaccharide biosynthesis glycosyltransferase